jgi:hypothetical protein
VICYTRTKVDGGWYLEFEREAFAELFWIACSDFVINRTEHTSLLAAGWKPVEDSFNPAENRRVWARWWLHWITGAAFRLRLCWFRMGGRWAERGWWNRVEGEMIPWWWVGMLK